MARSRRRFKQGKPTVKVGLLKNKKHSKPQEVTLPGMEGSVEWDVKATLAANYRAVGLVLDPNLKGGRQGGKFVEGLQAGQGLEADDSDHEPDDVRAALGKKSKNGLSAPEQRLTKMQRVYIGLLILKYGDDYVAMSKDVKVNKMQHSPGAIRKLCMRFLAYEKKPLVQQ
eukprot:jgi/Mesen1/9996/ME000072S09412